MCHPIPIGTRYLPCTWCPVCSTFGRPSTSMIRPLLVTCSHLVVLGPSVHNCLQPAPLNLHHRMSICSGAVPLTVCCKPAQQGTVIKCHCWSGTCIAAWAVHPTTTVCILGHVCHHITHWWKPVSRTAPLQAPSEVEMAVPNIASPSQQVQVMCGLARPPGLLHRSRQLATTLPLTRLPLGLRTRKQAVCHPSSLLQCAVRGI